MVCVYISYSYVSHDLRTIYASTTIQQTVDWSSAAVAKAYNIKAEFSILHFCHCFGSSGPAIHGYHYCHCFQDLRLTV